ncbi:MAG: YdcF family protein [Xanthomonadales bacterium]|nr:YdcF family protein [Xanthomonadales bacterium]
MSTVSNLSLRGALADSPLRESLLVTLLMLLVSGGLVFLASWGWVLYRAVRSDDRASVDWLIVCGHVLDAGRPSAAYRQRLRRAARLVAERPETRLLLAGGGEPSEAAVGRDWLVAECGLDAARVELEEISTDTFENLRHARGLLPPGARLGIVTSRFHLARVTVYARQLGLDAVPVAAEARWRPGGGNLVASLREAAFLCWFVCGRFWARLAGRRRLLERIR